MGSFLNNFSLETFIGIIGALIILIFFGLQQVHKISADDWRYDLGNFIGAILLVLYAVMIVSWPFGILNTVWAFVALRDLIKIKK
jgi:hypothetical protein